MTISITYLIISLIILIVIYLILREVNCWYWKINDRIDLQKETNELLREVINQNNSKVGTEKAGLNRIQLAEICAQMQRNNP